MKLSPQKIDHLAETLLDELVEIEGVLFQSSDADLLHAMREIIIDEITVEERLDAEVHQMLKAFKYEITMERINYDEIFQRTKRKLIRDRKLVL